MRGDCYNHPHKNKDGDKVPVSMYFIFPFPSLRSLVYEGKDAAQLQKHRISGDQCQAVCFLLKYTLDREVHVSFLGHVCPTGSLDMKEFYCC